MAFVERLTKPENGNPFYNTISAGGYSRAIIGKPTDPGCNVLANCVGYAFGRFHEISGRKEMDFFDPVDAEKIFANAKKHGMETGSVPELGALIVWQKGTQSSSDGAGHVACIERIGVGGEIITSESGYKAARYFWTTVRKYPYDYKDGYKLLGFVYQPKPYNPVYLPITKGQRGESVRWMQTQLARLGYLRTKEIDGSFGKITLGALLAFQFENGLEVDGKCGKKTVEKILISG